MLSTPSSSILTARSPARPLAGPLGQKEADVRTAPPHAYAYAHACACACAPRPCRPHGLNLPARPPAQATGKIDASVPPGVPLNQNAARLPRRDEPRGGGQPGFGGQ